MHEASVAESIVNTVLDVASKSAARKVLRVDIEIGEICLVNSHQLSDFIKVGARNTIAQDMQTSISEVKTQIKCHDCSYLGEVEYRDIEPSWHYKVPLFNCTQCKSSGTEIVRGKELLIKTIDVSF